MPQKNAQQGSLADYLAWDGCFASPHDAAAFCVYLSEALSLQQDCETWGPPHEQHQAKQLVTTQDVPWMACWTKASKELIRVGSFAAATACPGPGTPQTVKGKHQGLKKAFFVTPPAASGSSEAPRKTPQKQLLAPGCCFSFRLLVAIMNLPPRAFLLCVSVSALETLQGQIYVVQLVLPRAVAAFKGHHSTCPRCTAPRSHCSCNISREEGLAWEFRCTYSLKISDQELVVIPLRGALWGVERSGIG